MRTLTQAAVLGVIALAVPLAARTVCQQPSEPQPPKGDATQERQRQEEVAVLASAKAKLLEVRVGDDDQRSVKASLHGEPLLRWSNPTAGSVHGEVFLWHVEGRPTAVASIFRWYHPFKDRGGTLEIVSLSPSGVSARENNDVVWECESAGVRFHPVTEAAVPAATRSGRLTQMRSLARRFAAELKDERGGEQVVRKLRLLNQPIYRYESDRQGVIDGALFALAEVNDPEVILMLEVFKEGDTPQWRYAVARMNNHELVVRLDDRIVQTWPRIDAPWNDRKSSYTLFSFEPPPAKTDSPKAAPRKENNQ